MVIFPMSGVLRGACACSVQEARFGKAPCAALLVRKIPHS